MPPYVELIRSPLGIEENQLLRQNMVVGEVNGKATSVTITGDNTLIRHQTGQDEQILTGEQSATVFDRQGFLRRGVVYLSEGESLRLYYLMSALIPGALQDSLLSLWRRMEIQAGKRERGKWNLWRFIGSIMTFGRSEDWTEGL